MRGQPSILAVHALTANRPQQWILFYTVLLFLVRAFRCVYIIHSARCVHHFFCFRRPKLNLFIAWMVLDWPSECNATCLTAFGIYLFWFSHRFFVCSRIDGAGHWTAVYDTAKYLNFAVFSRRIFHSGTRYRAHELRNGIEQCFAMSHAIRRLYVSRAMGIRTIEIMKMKWRITWEAISLPSCGPAHGARHQLKAYTADTLTTVIITIKYNAIYIIMICDGGSSDGGGHIWSNLKCATNVPRPTMAATINIKISFHLVLPQRAANIVSVIVRCAAAVAEAKVIICE